MVRQPGHYGNWSNYWLNEGMAEFMAGQYWATKLGRRDEEDFYLDEYRQFLELDARRRVPLAAFNSNNVYVKGALVLEMLKKQLGPERFWASINRYLTRHAFGNAPSDDLRRAVLDATGRNLSWFWNQWVYQAGYPELVVSTAYDSLDGSLTLTVRQTQADTAKADSTGLRYSTPAVFRGQVSVRVATARGDVRSRVMLDQREQVLRIEGLRSAPTMVVFDEDNALLKSLTFEQPTAVAGDAAGPRPQPVESGLGHRAARSEDQRLRGSRCPGPGHPLGGLLPGASRGGRRTGPI